MDDVRELWDAEASTFDEAPDHGLGDPETRAAWRELLLEYLPPTPARVADLGCGTGTLSVLLAEHGYEVYGVDISPEMITRARAKTTPAPDLAVSFAIGDASDPDLLAGSFDVVLSRHVLWALPDPAAGLRRWCDLLKPDGRLLLVEGRWFNGAGLSAAQTTALVDQVGRTSGVRLLPESRWWGREIDDERYLVVSPAR